MRSVTSQGLRLAGLELCLRELAVNCPPEGRLGLHLATAARSLRPWLRGGDPSSITGLHMLLRELDRDMPRQGAEG